MAKGICVEVDNLARKVKKGYIGIDDIARKIKKGYIGDENGIARLFYSAETIINFSSCPFPTGWNTTVDYGKKYSDTNEYGTWTISSTGAAYDSNHRVYNAFDRNDDTYWQWGSVGQTIQIDCPIAIKPKHIYIWCYVISQTPFEGYNIETGNWETIYTLPFNSFHSITDTDITTENYYSKFRITMNSTAYYSHIAEFQITSGSYKPLS